MPNFRCKICHQWTQRRDRICSVHRDPARGPHGPRSGWAKTAASGKHVRLRGKTHPVKDQLAPRQPQLELNPPCQPQLHPSPSQQCQQCQTLQAEVGELRGMVANYKAKWEDALNQLANMQQRLASAEDRADWLQAAMRSGSLPPPVVQADARV